MIKIVNKNKYEKMIDRLNELEMENYNLGKVIDYLKKDNLARKKSIGELNNELLQTNNDNDINLNNEQTFIECNIIKNIKNITPVIIY